MFATKTSYQFTTRLDAPIDEALARTKEALKDEGFGILFELDMQKILKEKLNVDFQPYYVLGACNPPLANEALHTELEIGLLLPCHVVVYEDGDGSIVSTIDPIASLSIVHNPDLDPVADEVKLRFQQAITALSA
jgi:uncharacterized protein (DUF302 family)